jgi:hypothetical protein
VRYLLRCLFFVSVTPSVYGRRRGDLCNKALLLANIEALAKLHVGGERPLEFILAVPGRRYGECVDLLEPLSAQAAQAVQASEEIVQEARLQGHRLVVAHNPLRAAEQSQERLARIHALQQRADQLAGKLDAQVEGKVQRGRKLSNSGAKARFFHAVSDAHLGRIIKVDLQFDSFSHTIDEAALARAQLMHGKLMLVSNVPDMTPTEIVRRYKSLADIERGFKVLKSETEIAPVFHRLPERIKAHANICFMALILYRVMRQRLKLASSNLSPEAALAELRRIQRHTVSTDHATPIHGVSTLQPRQAQVLPDLKTSKPTIDAQLTLL